MRNSFFLLLIVLVAGALACSGDDESSSSPLQPSPLAPAPAGAGPSASPVSLTAGAGDVPGISRIAPLPQGFNAYDARIEYRDGEVTLTFVPVDMPKMPNAAREYRNRAVTVWQCPVEPHHVGQTCGEPVFWDSFAFLGSPSRTFPLADCAGWLVIEAAELSDDRYDGWRNAPLSCRTDEEGRTVADVDTGGGGAGWEDSRFDPPVRGGSVVVERPSAQSVVDAAIVAAGGLKPDLDPVSVAASALFEGTEGSTGAEYSATSSDLTVATVEVTDNPQVVITPVAPGTATIAVTFLKTEAAVEFDVTVTLPSLWPLDLTAPNGSRLVLEYPENGWSSGSCTFAAFEPLTDGPRCVIRVTSDALTNAWEFHLEYFRWNNSIGGPASSTESGCPGLTEVAWDGMDRTGSPGGSRIDYAARPGGANFQSSDPYTADLWLCMLRDFNLPGRYLYRPGRVRNASFVSTTRRVTFEIDFGSTLDGSMVSINLNDAHSNSNVASASEAVSLTSFPNK